MTDKEIQEIRERWEKTKKLIEPYINQEKCVEVNFRVDDIEYLLSELTQAQRELNDITDIARQNEAKFLRQKERADAAIKFADWVNKEFGHYMPYEFDNRYKLIYESQEGE